MFEEPEWVEAAPAAVGLRPATTQTRPVTAPPVKGCKRRHLLATLRALEAASLSQKSPSPPGSDSEEEEETGRKNKYLQRSLLVNTSKEVGEKRKRNCQSQSPSLSDSKSKEVERKCRRQTLGEISAEEEKGKRKCQKYSHSYSTQHLDCVDQTGSAQSSGSQQQGYSDVFGAVTKLGFKVIYKDLTNSHFFLFDFENWASSVGPKAQLSGLKLQPCLWQVTNRHLLKGKAQTPNSNSEDCTYQARSLVPPSFCTKNTG
ncbi:hypothetical protein STEG23_013715 [Scotinomys teguina]